MNRRKSVRIDAGGHPVVFTFESGCRRGADEKKDGYEQRRSSIQIVELEYKDGALSCDREKPSYVKLSR